MKILRILSLALIIPIAAWAMQRAPRTGPVFSRRDAARRHGGERIPGIARRCPARGGVLCIQ
jgi:hypothetical protein